MDELEFPDTEVSEIEIAIEDINLIFDREIENLLETEDEEKKEQALRLFQSKKLAIGAIKYSTIARTAMIHLRTILSVQ
ncbi:MAG TPA: hypothetical protein PKN22_03585 [Taishania sp.]|nr:hypothetical protein [Taishania sp.]